MASQQAEEVECEVPEVHITSWVGRCDHGLMVSQDEVAAFLSTLGLETWGVGTANGFRGVERPADSLVVWHDAPVDEAIPVLHVANVDIAVAWYERLGYEKEWEHRFEPMLPAFVRIARNGAAPLFLSEHTDDAGGELADVTTVYLRVAEIDSIAAQFGAEILEQPWGREVFLADPDGNRLRVGTLRP